MHTLEDMLSDQPFEVPDDMRKHITGRLAADLIVKMEETLNRNLVTTDQAGQTPWRTLIGTPVWEDALVEVARKHKALGFTDWYLHLPVYEAEVVDQEIACIIENQSEAIRDKMQARRKARQRDGKNKP